MNFEIHFADEKMEIKKLNSIKGSSRSGRVKDDKKVKKYIIGDDI